MNKSPTKPGQRCRVIGGRMNHNNEGRGPNIGKEVITLHMQPEQVGVERENVWRCQAKEGQTLVTYHGGIGNQADFLECWLDVIEPTPAQKGMQTAEELRGVLDA
jgi:hypothetical protein